MVICTGTYGPEPSLRRSTRLVWWAFSGSLKDVAEQVVLPPFQSQPCEGLWPCGSITSCCEFGARNPCLPLLAPPSQLVSTWLCARINAPPSAGVAEAWELETQSKSIYCLRENCPVMLSTHSTAGFVSSSSYMSVGNPTERHREMCQVLLLSKHLGGSCTLMLVTFGVGLPTHA